MKSIYILTVLIFLISSTGFSQDTTKYKQDTAQYKVLQRVNVNKKNRDSVKKNYKIQLKKQPPVIYRDTRLGSSSPLYDTYKKNDYGAGAVTTNPHKGGGRSFIYARPVIKVIEKDSLRQKPDSVIHD